jgi:flagellar P-ring protein precursor FlgI
MQKQSIFKSVLLASLSVFMLCSVLAEVGHGARIKDIASIKGIRSNPLYGFGLVVGLDGTGDGSDFTNKVVNNMLDTLRIGRNTEEIDDGDNVAAVMVTAELEPFARKGTRIDVTVSSFDQSTSLRGGTLLMTPLKGADGQVYAVGQGSVSVGGFSFGADAASISQGHTTVGRIPNGAVVEKEVPTSFVEDGQISFCLKDPDFVTASRIADVIESQSWASACVVDPATVRVNLVADGNTRMIMEKIARIQRLTLTPGQAAVVIINERTGTVVVGSNVSLSEVAISHGNLTVITRERPLVSQPQPFSETGQTVVVPRSDIEVTENSTTKGGLAVLEDSPTVSDVAQALNALGVGPRDIISIFQALSQAGALHAKLKIM